MTWSVHRLAARAVALHAPREDVPELLAMLGLVVDGRLTPDDCRVYELRHVEAKQESHEPNLTKRAKGCVPPPGLWGAS